MHSQMAKVSELITAMTLRGVTSDELQRVVNHSVVIMDALKSEEYNGIMALIEKYLPD